MFGFFLFWTGHCPWWGLVWYFWVPIFEFRYSNAAVWFDIVVSVMWRRALWQLCATFQRNSFPAFSLFNNLSRLIKILQYVGICKIPSVENFYRIQADCLWYLSENCNFTWSTQARKLWREIFPAFKEPRDIARIIYQKRKTVWITCRYWSQHFLWFGIAT